MSLQETTEVGERTPLFQSERQRKILALVDLHGAVEVSDLADRFGVTTETIRRDLSELQEKHLLQRVHGGAVSWSSFEPLVAKRDDAYDEDKRRIAARAVEELPDGGSVMIDAGSTLTRFAEVIPRGRNLHIVTNSLPTAQALAQADAAGVSILGGEIRSQTLSVVDAQAVEAVQRLNVDVLFISTDGATEAGLSTPYTFEASIKQAMIRSASHVVALVDPSKFGHDHLVRFGAWADIDILITGTETDTAMLDAIRTHGVEVVTV